MKLITPNIPLEAIFTGSSREFEATPPGTYTMTLESLSVTQTKAGESQLKAFFIHTEPSAKNLKGVDVRAMLEGTDKNGNPKAKATADLLVALGIDSADVAGGNFGVALEGEPESGAEWKGVPAAIYIKGDRVDLKGRTARVVVEAYSRNGKSGTTGKAAYRVAA